MQKWRIKMEFIGYMLIAIANVVLASVGINIVTWQWWVINICFMIGERIIAESN